MDISKRLKELCKEKEINYSELAEKAGVSKSTISHISRSPNIRPTLKTMEAICQGLGITESEFFSEFSAMHISRHEYFLLKYFRRLSHKQKIAL